MTEAPDGRRLLSAQELAEAGPPEAVRLPVELIDANPHNPRGSLVEIPALSENIRSFGLLQPITVRHQGERYELLGGHRRLAAFALLRKREPLDPQWRTIPAVVRTFDDDTGYLALISGQVHNRAWKPREEAAALERLVLAGRNLLQIGNALNRSEAWASKRLRIYSDVALSALVQTGRLASGVAEELLVIKDLDTRVAYAQRAADEQWSQDRARAETRRLRIDKRLSELGRRAREMAELLSMIDPSDIPLPVARDLWVIAGRVQSMARGPQLPTVEQAEKAAGVTARGKARDARKAGERRRYVRAKRPPG